MLKEISLKILSSLALLLILVLFPEVIYCQRHSISSLVAKGDSVLKATVSDSLYKLLYLGSSSGYVFESLARDDNWHSLTGKKTKGIFSWVDLRYDLVYSNPHCLAIDTIESV